MSVIFPKDVRQRSGIRIRSLDPGIGLLHVDTDTRDSLACDLMEPVTPQVDAYLLDWPTREPLRRAWFFEQRDCNWSLSELNYSKR